MEGEGEHTAAESEWVSKSKLKPILKWGDLRLDSLDYSTRLNRAYYDKKL